MCKAVFELERPKVGGREKSKAFRRGTGGDNQIFPRVKYKGGCLKRCVFSKINDLVVTSQFFCNFFCYQNRCINISKINRLHIYVTKLQSYRDF